MHFPKEHQINKDHSLKKKSEAVISKGGRPFKGVEIICGLKGCNKVKKLAKSRVMKLNFCSPEHFKEYQKGKKWWDKKFKDTQSGGNNHKFKGIMASESALHQWVNYHKGKALFCVDCGVTRNDTKYIDWSNQSGLYFRELDDYVGRCRPCHKKYDEKLGFPRKKCFDENGHRIGITLIFPKEYFKPHTTP